MSCGKNVGLFCVNDRVSGLGMLSSEMEHLYGQRIIDQLFS